MNLECYNQKTLAIGNPARQPIRSHQHQKITVRLSRELC